MPAWRQRNYRVRELLAHMLMPIDYEGVALRNAIMKLVIVAGP
jgi:hypothetical protein